MIIDAGSYFRRTDSCITQLKAQGPSRTCNENEEEEDHRHARNTRQGNARLPAALQDVRLPQLKTLYPPERNMDPKTSFPLLEGKAPLDLIGLEGLPLGPSLMSYRHEPDKSLSAGR